MINQSIHYFMLTSCHLHFIIISLFWFVLAHWIWVTHICVSKLTIIGSDHGLSPGRCQAMIWTNAEILLIGPLGKKISEILIEIHTFSFKKIHLKMSSGKWRPFCLGLNVLRMVNCHHSIMWDRYMHVVMIVSICIISFHEIIFSSVRIR